jgi:hypothetical protein
MRQEKDVNMKTPVMNGPEMVSRPGVTTEVKQQEVVTGPVTWEEMRALMKRESPMEIPTRTWRPTTGGILLVLAGSWNLLLGLGALFGSTFFSGLVPTFGGAATAASVFGIGFGAFFIVLGIISIIGGIMAINRSTWGWALAGSITALVPSPILFPFLMGILGLVFVSLGHLEFKGTDKLRAQK